MKPITGLPKGHVPRHATPADNSHLFADAAYHRSEAAINGEMQPLF